MLTSIANGVSLIIKLSFSIFAAHREALAQRMKAGLGIARGCHKCDDGIYGDLTAYINIKERYFLCRIARPTRNSLAGRTANIKISESLQNFFFTHYPTVWNNSPTISI